MISPDAMLPSEAFREVWTAERSRNPRQIYQTITELDARHDAALDSQFPEVYQMPVDAVLTLYRIDPNRFRSLALRTLGPYSTGDSPYWRRVSAIARDAYAAKDWQLLGRLCVAIDEKTAIDAGPAVNPAPQDHHAETMVAYGMVEQTGRRQTTGDEIVKAIQSFCNLRNAPIDEEIYFEIVTAYFHALPAEFVIPPELASTLPNHERQASSSAVEVTHPMLAFFWQSFHGNWRESPEAVERLAEGSHPMLSLLVLQMKRSKVEPVESEQATDPEMTTFGELSRGEAFPPVGEDDVPRQETADYDFDSPFVNVDPVRTRPKEGRWKQWSQAFGKFFRKLFRRRSKGRRQ